MATGHDDAALERELAGLRDEYDRLRETKVRAEENLASLERQLADLEARAVEEYGTADPEALETLLAERRAENARLVDEYRKHIAAVRQGLDELDNGRN
ncbi:MAG: hypothetical protein H0S85_17180 [Desulfovibrionaceae bacterium]|jgi:predicted  nucleic acid-binding Zn-ribbon protein|nr:hypothetical protein [Desulfovibrionaceae bacterium]